MIKTALITGPTGGIGKATAENLIADHDLFLWCRKPHEHQALVNHLLQIRPTANIWLCGCDLADWNQVKNEAKKVLSLTDKLDTLILNAGQYAHPCQYVNGLEINYRAGHLGHTLLAMLLKPMLEKSASPRIIALSSIAHRAGKALRPFKTMNSHNSIQEYADLKLANRLFAIAWSHLFPHIPAVSLHPGVVGSGFGNKGGWLVKLVFSLLKPFILTSEQGANTSIWLSRQPQDYLMNQAGHYFYQCKPTDTKGCSKKLNEALSLWGASHQVLIPVLKS